MPVPAGEIFMGEAIPGPVIVLFTGQPTTPVLLRQLVFLEGLFAVEFGALETHIVVEMVAILGGQAVDEFRAEGPFAIVFFAVGRDLDTVEYQGAAISEHCAVKPALECLLIVRQERELGGHAIEGMQLLAFELPKRIDGGAHRLERRPRHVGRLFHQGDDRPPLEQDQHRAQGDDKRPADHAHDSPQGGTQLVERLTAAPRRTDEIGHRGDADEQDRGDGKGRQ